MNIFTARLATMACKSAVKGNNKLSFQEADQLIDQLLTLEQSLSLSSWPANDHFHDKNRDRKEI